MNFMAKICPLKNLKWTKLNTAYLIRKLKSNCFLHIFTKLVLKWNCEGLAAILAKVNTKMCTLTTQLILLIWMKYYTDSLKLAIVSWNRTEGHLLGDIMTFSFIMCFPLWNLKKKTFIRFNYRGWITTYKAMNTHIAYSM